MNEQKAKKEKTIDRILGLAFLVVGIAGTIMGFRNEDICSNISFLWPVVGLAGLSLLIDSFLKNKVAKIVFNAILVIAIVIIILQLKSVNSDRKAQCQALQYELTEPLNE